MSSLSSIGQPPVAAQSDASAARAEQARKTAVDFEGVAIGELLQPMFDTVDMSKNMFGGGGAEQQFRSLQVLEMGKQIANSGGIGIADSVYRQILAMQEQAQQETPRQDMAGHETSGHETARRETSGREPLES